MNQALIKRLPQLEFAPFGATSPLEATRIAAPGSAHPAVLAALARQLKDQREKQMDKPAPLLVGTPGILGAESLVRDLKVWLGDSRVELLPAWETLPFERVSPSISAMGRRLRVLSELANPVGALDIVVAPTRALVQKSPPHQIEPFNLSTGAELEMDELIEWLIAGGYRRQPQVLARGEMAVRGGIIDVFASAPLAAGIDNPLRIEFFGDSLESMRIFSLADQLTVEPISNAVLFPAREFMPDTPEREKAAELAKTLSWGRDHWEKLANGAHFEGMESWMGWLVDKDLVPVEIADESVQKVWVQKAEMLAVAKKLESEEAELAGALMQGWGAGADILPPRLCASFERATASLDSSTAFASYQLDDVPDTASSYFHLAAENWGATGAELIQPIKQLLADGYAVLVAAHSDESCSQLAEIFSSNGLDFPVLKERKLPEEELAGGAICTAPIEMGCIFTEQKLAIICESQLTNKQRSLASLSAGAASVTPAPFSEELVPGSFVVHKNHGIGKYLGTEVKEIGGTSREYLLIQYRGSDRLFLPAEQIGMLSLHSVGETPRLNSLGGGGWKKTRKKAKAEAEEIARELVQLYGERSTLKGHRFLPDGPAQQDLAAQFEFEETPDQLAAIQNTIADMEKPVPMDRLIYGDVGFGKTEIAIRAAFKAISENKQAALLVPTTLLARQHHQTFRERYENFPARVEMLSRFVSSARTQGIVEAVATGEVDLLIGTHRLFSKDIKFKDLGLLIIDEEQRFGVRHKEKLKSIYKDTDILTLTATPIPRTLEMSLTGIRDFSLIKTPPQDRHPILTYVGAYDRQAVKEAINRELLREGQVFFVHNRISNISEIHRELSELVPTARIAVAHGRMNESQLEQVVLDFTDKKYDVLVCTTIIESGIDMPRVNTLVVNRAEMLGLGQMHQLRGRVGRAGTQAYAYFFSSPTAVMTPQAYERLKTLGESTALGSGFQLAMRDLEVRGAGNLLGFGQSGHIGSVGYDIYCDLVAEAVGELKGIKRPPPKKEVSMDLPVDARLPEDYVTEESLRLEAYRKLFVATDEEISDIQKQWRDRFGPLPEPARALLAVARLKGLCADMGFESLAIQRLASGQSVARLFPFAASTGKIQNLQKSLDGFSYNSEKREISFQLAGSEGIDIDSSDNLINQLYSVLAELKALSS